MVLCVGILKFLFSVCQFLSFEYIQNSAANYPFVGIQDVVASSYEDAAKYHYSQCFPGNTD